MLQKQSPDPDWTLKTAQERVGGRIGKELAEKYRELRPLLALLDYRYIKDIEKSGDWQPGLIYTLYYDTLWGKKPFSQALISAVGAVLWAAAKMKYVFRKKAEIRLAFSNTFLFSRRYPTVREQVENKTGCTAVLTFHDMAKVYNGSLKDGLKDALKLDVGSVRPVFIPRRSISGGKLQQAVAGFYELLCRDGGVPEAEMDAALSRMREAYTRRVAYLTKKLKKESLKAYLTVNQYNLRDLLIVHACRDLGITTANLEHHAMEFAPDQFDPEHLRQRLSFVSHYGYWSATEEKFHRKVFRYDNQLYPEGANRYFVSGNAELSYEQMAANQAKYPVERKLTFMTNGVEHTAYSPEELERYEQWRWDVFTGLRRLAEKQKIRVCVRYRPFKEMYFREKEIPTLTEWGFKISESLPENLMEDMCSSLAVMASTSSVLATARLLGKFVCRVADMNVRFIHVDDRVHEVTPEGIADLVIPEEAGGQIDPEGFFSIDRVLEAL